MNHGIDFTFSWVKESAPRLPDEIFKGAVKGRLRIANYGAGKGQDIHAVATEILSATQGSKPKLGCLEKHFNIVVKDLEESDVYYKINKKSLQKRLGISPELLKEYVNPKTGEVENVPLFNKMLQNKFQSALANDISICVDKCLEYAENPYAIRNKRSTEHLIEYLEKQSSYVLQCTITTLVQGASDSNDRNLIKMLARLNQSANIAEIIQKTCLTHHITLPLTAATEMTEEEHQRARQIDGNPTLLNDTDIDNENFIIKFLAGNPQQRISNLDQKMVDRMITSEKIMENFDLKLILYERLAVLKRESGESIAELDPAILALLLKHLPTFVSTTLTIQDLERLLKDEEIAKSIDNCLGSQESFQTLMSLIQTEYNIRLLRR